MAAKRQQDDAEAGGGGAWPEGLERAGTDFVYSFRAMATPCEVRIETDDADTAARAGKAAEDEALRIERKFTRYRDDSVVGRINASGGRDIEVDPETEQLLDFADHCHAISNGQFDITSGVLRRIWRFDGSDRLPSEADIKAIRKSIGWSKVRWIAPRLRLPAGMEIDLGGIGKEYAVDRAHGCRAGANRTNRCWSISAAICVCPARARAVGAGAWLSNPWTRAARPPACWKFPPVLWRPAAMLAAFC